MVVLLQTAAVDEFVRPLLEPIVHPARLRRVRVVGACMLLGHPVFYAVWGHLLPQAYESAALRLAMSALGGWLLVSKPLGRFTPAICALVFWLSMPLFCSWMYLCNAGSAVWLASMCVMLMLYYDLSDWRIATVGALSGGAVAWLLFRAAGPGAPVADAALLANGATIAFSWCVALILGLSASNLRRVQLNSTLATIGIMAHGLRTPLATMSLIGDAMRMEAHEAPPSVQRLDELTNKLRSLVLSMNHQIDLQIANARLLRLPMQQDAVRASELVRRAVAEFPYRGSRERDAVEIHVRQDFTFVAPESQFLHVMGNLIKNALRSIAATNRPAVPGDLRIEISVLRRQGRIVVADQGTGVEPALQRHIFEPFFSTDRESGHGLGLAFCDRVVHNARGSIRLSSRPGHGSSFSIDLPLAP